jgi:hypothetical protein
MIRGDEFQARPVIASLRDGKLIPRSGFPTAAACNQSWQMISGFGLELFLRYGFAPPPLSLWNRVFVANCGETLRRGHASIESHFQPSFIGPRSGQERLGKPEIDPDAGAAAYLAALRQALLRIMTAQAISRILFMQSAGKDSSVIAEALAALRPSFPSVQLQPITYRAGIRDSESPLVAAINRSLGLPPPLIVAQDCPAEIACAERFLAKAENVVGDLALVPYLGCLEQAECGPGDIVVDGLGGTYTWGWV